MCYTARWTMSPRHFREEVHDRRERRESRARSMTATPRRPAAAQPRGTRTARGAAGGLSDEEMTRPGVTEDWSVKDHLVHLTWWEQRVILMLSGAADPIDAIPNGQEGDDTINAHVY